MASPVIKDDSFYNRVLERCQLRLLEDLEPVSLLDTITETGFIPTILRRDIEEERLSSDKIRKILHYVSSKGVEGYRDFKILLIRSHQAHLAEYLEEQEHLVEGEIEREPIVQEIVAMQQEYSKVPTEKELLMVAGHIGMNWEMLGPYLGISSAKIDHIKIDYQNTIMRIFRMLKTWCELNGRSATVDTLLQLLEEASPAVNIDLVSIKGVFYSTKKGNKDQETGPILGKSLKPYQSGITGDEHFLVGDKQTLYQNIGIIGQKDETPFTTGMNQPILYPGPVVSDPYQGPLYAQPGFTGQNNSSVQAGQDDPVSLGTKLSKMQFGNTRANDANFSNQFEQDHSRSSYQGNIIDGLGDQTREQGVVDDVDAVRRRSLERGQPSSTPTSTVSNTVGTTATSTTSAITRTGIQPSSGLYQNTIPTDSTGSGNMVSGVGPLSASNDETQSVHEKIDMISADVKVLNKKVDRIYAKSNQNQQPTTNRLTAVPAKTKLEEEGGDGQASTNTVSTTGDDRTDGEKRDQRLNSLFTSADDIPGRLKELEEQNVKDLMDYCGQAREGVGGFGDIFFSKKEIPGLNMKVAIKKISLKKDAEDWKMTSITNEKLASRTMHFAIVPLLALREDHEKKTFYFVTPYFENGDLFEAIQKDNETLKTDSPVKLDAGQRLRIMYQISAAIHFLHTPVQNYRGVIIHMDIKTLNIVLDKNLNARLIDFGLAREMRAEEQGIHTTTRELAHTEGYYRTMRDQTMTQHIDYYNLGVVIREMLTGLKPYQTGQKREEELRNQEELFLEDHLLKMWERKKGSPNALASKLIELSSRCIEDDQINSSVILDKILELLKNMKGIPRWSIGESSEVNASNQRCELCLVAKKVEDKIFEHESNCKNKINICIACTMNSYLSPIHCHSCDKEIKPIVGHNWAALLIAGSDKKEGDKNGANTNLFKNDIDAIESVITSKCPLVMGIDKTKVKKIYPTTSTDMTKKLKEAISFFNKNEDLHTMFIYYSGHYFPKAITGRNREGFQLGPNEYLTLIDLQSILSPFLHVPNASQNTVLSSRRLIVVFDCCKAPSLMTTPVTESQGLKNNLMSSDNIQGPSGDSIQSTSSTETSLELSKHIPFLNFNQTGNYSIVQMNASSQNDSTYFQQSENMFRTFMVQALTRNALRELCHNGCNDCRIDGLFINMHSLAQYITSHLEAKGCKSSKPVLHDHNVSSHDAKIGYVVNYCADFKFKYSYNNKTFTENVPQRMISTFGELRALLFNIFCENMRDEGCEQYLPTEMADIICVYIQHGPKTKHWEELDTIEKIIGAWYSKRELMVSLRMLEEISLGKVGVFFKKSPSLRFELECNEYAKKEPSGISYTIEACSFPDFGSSSPEEIKPKIRTLRSIAKKVKKVKKKEATRLHIELPVKEDGETLLREDFVCFTMEWRECL